MKEYLVPTGDGEAQFIERRSRFIGHIVLTETEEEALRAAEADARAVPSRSPHSAA